MNKQENKDILQEEVLSNIVKNGGHGIVALSTGSGKTKIAIDYIKYLDNPRVLWVVPFTKLRDVGIPAEFEKWGAADIFHENVETICYASLKNVKSQKYTLIILDEGHKITTLSSEFFDDNSYGRILFLSATIPHEKEKLDILNGLGLKVIHSLEVNSAVEKQIVADFMINVVATPISYKDKYIEKKRKKDNVSFFVTEGSQYEYWSEVIAKARDKGPVPKHLYFNRMRIIYNSKTKFEVARNILNRIPDDKRVLIFCSNIDQAEKLCEYSYHSKTADTYYEAFNSKEINRLSVVNALTEGHNMVDVDYAVMVQVNSNARNYIQKQGRAIRWRPGHKAMIYIVKLLGTVDELWVNSSIESIDSKRIRNFKFEK